MWRWMMMVVMAVAAAGCGERGAAEREGEENERLRVVASIFPLGSLAERVVGEAGQVTVLLPAGRSPHAFELTVRQVRELADADVLVVAGGGVDPWATRAAERFGQQVRVVDVDAVVRAARKDASGVGSAVDEIDEMEHDHGRGAVNPHHWLDPKRAAEFVSHLGTELARDFPAHSETLLANTKATLDTILAVDALYRAQLRGVKRREMVAFHNAFDLLAERYGLEVVAHLTPIELVPGGEVTPGRLEAVLARIEEHDLEVIYAEPQFPETAVAALRERAGVAVLRLDPLGDPRREGYDSWEALMRSNLETLVEGQSR
ncbi:MAG: metal ABC transporter substrate-binding protein [Phycisphaeraceae bacterium]